MPANMFAACEALADERYASLPLPGDTWADAAWCLLAACDDMQRFGLIGVARKTPEDFERIGQAVAFQLLDDFKYALRYALDRARTLPGGRHAWGRTLEESPHNIAGNTLRETREYARVCRYFAACHESAFPFECIDGRTLTIQQSTEQLQYGTLEVLLSVFTKPRTSFLSMFFNWTIRGALPAELRDVVRKSRSKYGRVEYRFRFDSIREYASLAAEDEPLIPTEWRFPWGGSATETCWMLNVLCATALYHACVVQCAQLGTVPDNGASALCWTLGAKALARHLFTATGLRKPLVDELLRALSYGEELRTPDPALQPVVRLSEDAVAIAPLTLMGGDSQRNILSLHARYDRKSFDRQSHLFEQQMVSALSLVLQGTPYDRRLNTTLSLGLHREEFDVILIDDAARVIVFLELRWMLPPGDPREVSNRLSACREKVRQLERKLLRVRENIAEAFRCLKRSYTAEWSVFGVVVIEGYSVFVPELPGQLPVIPFQLAKISLKRFESLTAWLRWIDAKKWLPIPGRDFAVESRPCRFGQTMIDVTEARLIINGATFSQQLSDSMEDHANRP